jgi:hypothetical protein
MTAFDYPSLPVQSAAQERAEIEREMALMRAYDRNIEIQGLRKDAERFIQDLAGVLREALHKLPKDDPTYTNVANAIEAIAKRIKHDI